VYYNAVDLDTGAIVGITVQGADEGDTTTIQETLPESAEQLEARKGMAEEIMSTYHVAYERDESGWWVASVREVRYPLVLGKCLIRDGWPKSV
jgi:hypothetical protein